MTFRRNCKTASARPKPRKDFMTRQRQEILPDAGEKGEADAEL